MQILGCAEQDLYRYCSAGWRRVDDCLVRGRKRGHCWQKGALPFCFSVLDIRSLIFFPLKTGRHPRPHNHRPHTHSRHTPPPTPPNKPSNLLPHDSSLASPPHTRRRLREHNILSSPNTPPHPPRTHLVLPLACPRTKWTISRYRRFRRLDLSIRYSRLGLQTHDSVKRGRGQEC